MMHEGIILESLEDYKRWFNDKEMSEDDKEKVKSIDEAIELIKSGLLSIFSNIIAEADREQLDKMDELLQKEIRLSDLAIEEEIEEDFERSNGNN